MNTIVETYSICKNVNGFDELVNALRECASQIQGLVPPIDRFLRKYPANVPLFEKCLMIGEDWARFQYAKSLRPRALVSDIELEGIAGVFGDIFYSIIRAGAVKTLYLMKQEAIDFLESTAFTQKLDLEFFSDNFSKPIVLYSGEPRTLFDDVLSIQLTYNEEDRSIHCMYSQQEANGRTREFCRIFGVEELYGAFTKDSVVFKQGGEGVRFMLVQGIVNDVGELHSKMYRVMLFAFKFVLLMQCDKQPLVSERQFKHRKNVEKAKTIFGRLNYQRVSLTTVYRAAKINNKEETVRLDKEGKTLKATEVRGFLRRQHYGPGNSLIKVVYIEAHDSHSWMKEGIRIVKVVR